MKILEVINFEQVVASAVSGSESAFRKLYDLSSPKAYYAALCITKKESDAVNIVQSSYSTMRQRLPRLKYPLKFESWFYRIVCKCIFDHISKTNKSLFRIYGSFDVSEFNDELDSFYYPDADPGTSQTDRFTVINVLDRLPVDSRLCILMYYYFKMNVTEISTILSLDGQTVVKFLDEAKKIIKVNIKDSLAAQNRTINCSPIIFFSGVLEKCDSHVPFKATDMILGNIFRTRGVSPQVSVPNHVRPDPTIRRPDPTIRRPDPPQRPVAPQRPIAPQRPVMPQQRQVISPQRPPVSSVQRHSPPVSESDATLFCSNEELEEIIRRPRSTASAPSGRESSKGGEKDEDSGAIRSAATFAKAVIIILICIVFIVAIYALMKNVESNNESATSSASQIHIISDDQADSYKSFFTAIPSVNG